MKKAIVSITGIAMVICCVLLSPAAAALDSIASHQIIPVSAAYAGKAFESFSSEGDSSGVSVSEASGGGYAIDFFISQAGDYAGVSFHPLVFPSATVNASSYKYLRFMLSASAADIPMKIELQTVSGTAGRKKAQLYISDYVDGGISTTPQEVRIPLSAFANLDDLSHVQTIGFVFEYDYALANGFETEAIVTISGLTFETGTVSAVRIDHFGDNSNATALGGTIGSMPSAVAHAGAYHLQSFDADDFSAFPRSFRSEYNVGADPWWAGFFMLFGGGSFSTATVEDPDDGWYAMPSDFSDFNYLSLKAKAASEADNPKTFKLEIIFGDAAQKVFVLIPSMTIEKVPLSDQWQDYTIDLNMVGTLEKGSIKQVNVVYENTAIENAGGATHGVVFFDQMQFEKDYIVDDITIAFEGTETVLIEGSDMTVTGTTYPEAVDSYQWYLDDVLIEGETASSITIGSGLAPREEPYVLRLDVSAGALNASESFSFTVEAPPVTEILISFEGAESTLVEGSDMTVSATTDPAEVDSYQWYLDDVLIEGETASSITIGSDLASREEPYVLMVEVTIGSVSSSESINFLVHTTSLDGLIDDFNDGADPNYWGGSFSPNHLAFAELEKGYDPMHRRGESGYGYYMTYDVSTPLSWGFTRLELGGLRDLRQYTALSFWVKGSVANVPLKLELIKEELSGQKGSVYIADFIEGGVSTEWKKVVIPLQNFANVNPLTDVDKIIFVFENQYAQICGYPTQGTLYIDDIQFESVTVDTLVIDQFRDGYSTNAIGGNNGDMPNAQRHSTIFSSDSVTAPWSLLSSYSVDFSIDDWAGYWMIFGGGSDGFTPQPVDISDYRYLTFWAKAVSNTQNPQTITIELIDEAGVHPLILEGLTTEWKQYSFDLDAIAAIDQHTAKQINIVYEKSRIVAAGGSLSGAVHFDNVCFTKTAEQNEMNTLVLSGSNAIDQSIQWFHEIRTVTVYHGPNLPGPWPDPTDHYTYITEKQVEKSMWPWVHADSPYNVLEDRYMVKFDLDAWYDLGLSVQSIDSVELSFTITNTDIQSWQYQFAVHTMNDREEEPYNNAELDFSVSTTPLQTFDVNVDATAPNNMVELTVTITDEVFADISNSQTVTGILIKSTASELETLTITNPTLRINYEE